METKPGCFAMKRARSVMRLTTSSCLSGGHGRDLSDEGIAFQNVSHGKTFPEILSDNAEPIAAFMAGYVRNPTFQEPSAVELSYVRFTPKSGHVQCKRLCPL
jgi:hypothetical protein